MTDGDPTKAAGAKPKLSRTYRFGETTMSLPWVKEFKSVLKQYVAMAAIQDDPAARMTGESALDRVVQEIHDNLVELYFLRLQTDEDRERQAANEREKHRRFARNGKKGAKIRWEGAYSKDVKLLLASLAMQRDMLGRPLPATELWPHFHSGLDELGLRPRESADSARITWEGHPSGVDIGTFENKISTARGNARLAKK